MKKTLAFIIAMLMMFCMSTAFAFNWQEAETEDCEKYAITITKYSKVGEVGSAYQKAPAATAKKGEKLYWDIEVIDADGNPVSDYEVELNGVDYEGVTADGLSVGKAVSDYPSVHVSIVEHSEVTELTYENEPVYINGETVIIGDVAFLRNEKGIVTDAQHVEGNTAKLLEELNKLGIHVSDIYDGNTCMTDEVLIKNFGSWCETSAKAVWYYNSAPVDMEIPKTGDMSLFAALGTVMACIGVFALLVWIIDKAKCWKR